MKNYSFLLLTLSLTCALHAGRMYTPGQGISSSSMHDAIAAKAMTQKTLNLALMKRPLYLAAVDAVLLTEHHKPKEGNRGILLNIIDEFKKRGSRARTEESLRQLRAAICPTDEPALPGHVERAHTQKALKGQERKNCNPRATKKWQAFHR